MAHLPKKNVLLDGAFIHASVLADQSIHMGLTTLFPNQTLEVSTTRCVREELLKKFQNKALAKEYEPTWRRMESTTLQSCNHAASKKFVSGVECVQSFIGTVECVRSVIDTVDGVRGSDLYRSEDVDWVLATNDAKLLKSFNFRKGLQVVSVANGKITLVHEASEKLKNAGE